MKTLKTITLILASCLAILSCVPEDLGEPKETVIESISPAEGYEGTKVVLTGQNFSSQASDLEIEFRTPDGSIKFTPKVLNPTSNSLEFVVPEGSKGHKYQVGVSLKGWITKSWANFNVLDTGLAIQDFRPLAVEPGYSFLIFGNKFEDSIAHNKVFLVNGTETYTLTIQEAAPGILQVVAPTEIPAGDYSIQVSAKGETAVKSGFKILPSTAPVITSFEPLSATAGSSIKLKGRNFNQTPGYNSVTFQSDTKSFRGTVTTSSSSELTVTIPYETVPGNYAITNRVGDRSATSASKITITPPPSPIITSIEPGSAVAKTSVKINGSNFNPAVNNNTVTIFKTGFSASVSVTAASATELTITIPDVAPGDYTIKILTTGAENPASTSFTVSIPPPVISSVSPSEAIKGSSITLFGTNFSSVPSENSITFESGATSVPASLTSSGISQLACLVPNLTPGNYTIRVTKAGVATTATASFAVLSPPTHTISSLSATSGEPGDLLTINGSNFNTQLADNSVSFTSSGGTPVVAKILEASATKLKVVIPAKLTANSYSISALCNGNTATAAQTYSVTIPSNKPVVTGFSPGTILRGNMLTVTGYNFKKAGVVTAINFMPVGGGVTIVRSGSVNSDGSQFTFTIPATGFSTGKYNILIDVDFVSDQAAEVLTVQ